jgi:F-type H+-transporting ATPase subunit epsilon
MPEKKMQLDIVSVEAQVYSGTATFIQATGSQGELGIYPGHTALITSIKPGQVLATDEEDNEHIFFIAGGVIEIQPDKVTILSDTAIRADDLDEASALAIKEKAEKALIEQQSEVAYSAALSELAMAAAQLKAINQLRDRAKK